MRNILSKNGFTLIELIVVMAIISILATQMIISISSSTAKLKGEAFSFRGDMVIARSEAVNRNTNVLIEFVKDCKYVSGGTAEIDETTCGVSGDMDGYRICVDDDDGDAIDEKDNSCSNADVDAPDTLIKDVLFRREVQFYGTFAPGGFPADGPNQTRGGTSLNTADNLDGIQFALNNDYFLMQPDGTCTDSGSVIIYVPGGNLTMAADPISLAISSVGVIALYRWDSSEQAWGVK